MLFEINLFFRKRLCECSDSAVVFFRGQDYEPEALDVHCACRMHHVTVKRSQLALDTRYTLDRASNRKASPFIITDVGLERLRLRHDLVERVEAVASAPVCRCGHDHLRLEHANRKETWHIRMFCSKCDSGVSSPVASNGSSGVAIYHFWPDALNPASLERKRTADVISIFDRR